MKLQINFKNEEFILINLFENDAINKWFEYFAEKACFYEVFSDCTPPRYQNININTEWMKIKRTFKILRKLKHYPDIHIANKFDGRQQTLNILHRFFTYSDMWAHECVYGSSIHQPTNPYDAEFKFPQNLNYKEWHDIIDNINVAVHNLETTIQISSDIHIQHLQFSLKNDNEKKWYKFTQSDYFNNFKYFDIKEKYGNLVLLDRSILGKCVLQSFMEDDDPCAKDCTGRLGSFGGFVIETDDNRLKIYKSDKFTDWYKRHGLTVDDLPLEFPIGYIANSNIVDLSNVDRLQKNYIQVKFI